MISIETMLADMPASSGAAPDSMAEQQKAALATLPEELERLAGNIETFVSGQRRPG